MTDRERMLRKDALVDNLIGMCAHKYRLGVPCGLTQREIQIPQSWSDSGIAVLVNRGAFATIKSLYLFVIDGSGAVSPGFRL